jgi:hypothetical protein
LERRPVNSGNTAGILQITALWEQGEEVRAWARYWKLTADFVVGQLENDDALRRASILVSFERLCETPAQVLDRICAHCGFDGAAGRVVEFAARIKAPAYYSPEFSDTDLAVIREETDGVKWPT